MNLVKIPIYKFFLNPSNVPYLIQQEISLFLLQ